MLKLLFKLLLIAGCFWYISQKIDFSQAWHTLKQANPGYLALAAACFTLSKLIAAFRLNLYFRNTGLQLPELINIRLYWLGMFYNLFLPGSIGGDAYKAVLLSRQYNIPVKKTGAAILIDRFSGLLGLGLVLSVFAWVVLAQPWMALLITAVSLMAVLIFYAVIRRWFAVFLPSFNPTLLGGTGVQLAQSAAVILILAALGNPAQTAAYLFLFLLSSVVAVLPFTIGGLGLREVVFLEGAVYFGLPRETAVAVSLLFYMITLCVSALGAIEILRNPLHEKRVHS